MIDACENAPDQLVEQLGVINNPQMQRIERGMEIVVVDDYSSSGTDPFASIKLDSEAEEQRKERDLLRQRE